LGWSKRVGNPLDFSEKFISFEIIPIFTMSEFKIKLQLKKDIREGVLGIAEIASVLQRLQDTIYNIAEFNIAETTPDKKRSFRITGKRPSYIEKRAKLTFNQCSIGSFDAEIIGEAQVPLVGKTMVDEAIDAFGNITYILNSAKEIEKEVKKIIPDSRHRSRIIRVMGEFWPGYENKYNIFLETAHFKHGTLNRERKRTIQHIAKEEQLLEKETATGVLAGGHLIRERKFELEMTDGRKIQCQFKKELDATIDKLLRKPIVVEGVFTTQAGELKKVAEVISVKLLNNISRKRIITEKGELKLKKELRIEISFDKDEGLWLFDYPELNIFSYGKTYDEAIEVFQNDFYELYEYYGLGDPKTMVGNALKIRQIFNILVER